MSRAPPGHDALMAALSATWPPAETARLGGWLLRRGLGGGRRASSVWPRQAPDGPLTDAVDAAEARMRAWGQRPSFQLGPGAADAALDAALAARGYAVATPCAVLAAPAAEVARHKTGGRMVIEVRAALALLDGFWAEGGIGPARRAVMARAAEPKAVLMLRSDDDRVAAAFFVAAHDDVAVMSALLVAPTHRRLGLGAQATAAAAQWAVEAGAEALALSVERENEGARALYARLGLVEATCYHYRDAPGSP